MPGFGPDGFISHEYEPQRLEVPEKWSQDDGGYVQSFEGYDESILKDCVWSPDKTKCISTGVVGDEFSEVRFLDLKAKLDLRLTFCGMFCSFRSLAWLDNDTFMFVDNQLYLYHSTAKIESQKGYKVFPTICIYKTSPELLVSLIGAHIGPAVDDV